MYFSRKYLSCVEKTDDKLVISEVCDTYFGTPAHRHSLPYIENYSFVETLGTAILKVLWSFKHQRVEHFSTVS